jgi:hypothetical protein
MKKSILLLLFFLLVISSVNAQGMVLSNSADWRDVYSTSLYGNILGIENKFLTSTRHSTIILGSIAKGTPVQIISSSDNPFVVGYDTIMSTQGYNDVEELTFDNINLELARLLEDVTKFIIVDDSYGYNALAVASFAVIGNYYVLFADDRNIGQIENFLEGIFVDEIIIYGQVDRDVKDALTIYNPEIINLGDRFDNNVEIVKKYLEIKPTKQTVLTNGEFIETSVMSGYDPVLFIGRSNVPDQIKNFLQDSEIEIGILIGNELIGTATEIRRQAGISVFVKFAQSPRSPTGGISQVEDLDRFPMPKYSLNMGVFSVFYNRATGRLEVTFQNNVDLITYFLSTITITAGDETIIVGDEEGVFIDGLEFKTMTYDLELPTENNVTAEVFTIFGESQKSLENIFRGTFPVETVEIFDESAINITDLYYDAGSGAFFLEVKNVGNVGVYVDVELIDLWVNGEFVIVGGDEIIFVEPGKTAKVKISVELVDEEIESKNNQILIAKAIYGERENSLINSVSAEFEFKLKKADYMFYALMVVVIGLFFLIIFKRRNKKDDEQA